MEGMIPQSIWTDQAVWNLGSWSSESTGFATQKPLGLLERIIDLSSKPGDLVGDFFAGSGTSLIAAHRLKRNWLGIESNPHNIQLIKSCFYNETNTSYVLSVCQPTPQSNHILELVQWEHQPSNRYIFTYKPLPPGYITRDHAKTCIQYVLSQQKQPVTIYFLGHWYEAGVQNDIEQIYFSEIESNRLHLDWRIFYPPKNRKQRESVSEANTLHQLLCDYSPIPTFDLHYKIIRSQPGSINLHITHLEMDYSSLDRTIHSQIEKIHNQAPHTLEEFILDENFVPPAIHISKRQSLLNTIISKDNPLKLSLTTSTPQIVALGITDILGFEVFRFVSIQVEL